MFRPMNDTPATIEPCIQCNECFKSNETLRTPLSLNCLHVACEACIRDALCNYGQIVCKQCGTVSASKTSLDSKFSNLRENFPICKNILEELSLLEKKKPIEESTIGFRSSQKSSLGTNQLSLVLSAMGNGMCAECSQLMASLFCQECKLNFCDSCFNQTHRSKVFRNHIPIFLENRAEFLLGEYYNKLTAKKIKMENTIKTLSNPNLLREAKSSGLDWPQLTKDLKLFFTKFYEVVSNMEDRVMQRLNEEANSIDRSYANCMNKLKADLNNINYTLQEMYGTLESNVGYSRCDELILKAQHLLKAPDQICTRRAVAPESLRIPSFEWVQDLEKMLNFDYGERGEIYSINSFNDTLDNSEGSFHFSTPLTVDRSSSKSIETSSDGSRAMDVISENSIKGSARKMSDTGTRSVEMLIRPRSDDYTRRGDRSTHSLNSDDSRKILSERNYRMDRFRQPKQIAGPSLSGCGLVSLPHYARPYSTNNSRIGYHYEDNRDAKISVMKSISLKSTKFVEGYSSTVTVTHVLTPSNFFVQLNESNSTMDKYRKFFSVADKLPMLKREDVQLGNLFVALCSDKEWYRVRVMDFPSGVESISAVQIDTGKTEMIEVENLRRIDDVNKAFLLDPELAIRCSIFDCHPVKVMWKPDDTNFFKQTLRNKSITMIVKKVQASKLEVDLLWTGDGSTLLTSIRDYMVMTKHACISSKKEHKNNELLYKDVKYFYDKEYHVNEWVDVKVTHIETPDHFYINRLSCADSVIFAQMAERLDTFFKNKSNYLSMTVTNHAIGLAVAAQFSDDNLWYRAIIIKVMPHMKHCVVRYVDFGNTESLHYSKIRYLPKDFIKFTAQAVRCSLNEIKPISDTYGKAATNFFAKQVNDRKLKMVIEEIKNDVLHVLLYYSNEAEDVCINALLVQQEFAVVNGKNLGPTSYPKIKPVARKAKKSEINFNVAVEESIPAIEDAKQEINENYEISEKLEVNVLSFVTPSEFYISFPELTDDVENLISDMFRYYRDKKNYTESVLEKVDVDMMCAAYIEKDEKWYRARVKTIEGDFVTVFLTDVARTETTLLENTRVLHSKFCQLKDGAVACHLVGIEERNGWPTELCELLQTKLSNFNAVYIIPKYKSTHKHSLAVELLGKMVVCQGPFDPFVEQWTNINEMLMKDFASDRRSNSNTDKESYIPPPESILRQLDDRNGEITSIGHVQEWLQKNVIEATEEGVAYDDIVTNGEIPPEHLFSPEHAIVCNDRVKTVRENFEAMNNNSETTNDLLETVNEDYAAPDGDWLPAEPLTQTEFFAMVSFVEDDLSLYLQLEGKQRKVLEIVSKGLQSRYKDSIPLPMDMNWFPGQMCIAQFQLDNKWYRGRVLAVKDDNVRVEYVDFGNTAWVVNENLRKNVALHTIPIQCHKIPIRSDCVPVSKDGKWPVGVLDFIHYTIVEKTCKIKLRKEKYEDFYRVEKLVIVEGVELFELLCSLNHAKIISTKVCPKKEDNDAENLNTSSEIEDIVDDFMSDASSSIAPIESASNIDINDLMLMSDIPDFSDIFAIPQNPQRNETVVSYFKIPPGLGSCTIEVTEILRKDTVVVHIIESNNSDVNENRSLFNNMELELQNKASKQPLLKPPYKGRICSLKFDDGMWYRGNIIEEPNDEDKVPILYIDYGNSSVVDIKSLHQMKRSWFNVPAQAIRCQLIDFEIKHCDDIINSMIVQLLNNKYKAIIEVSSEDESYAIKLLEEVQS